MMNSLLYRKKINQSGRKPGIIILRRTGLHIPLQEVSCNVTSSIVTGSLPLLPNTLLRYEDYHRPGSLLDVFDAAKNSLQKPDYRNRATRLQSFGYWGGLVLPAELVADLVDAGFYLISQPDVVRCCSCSLVVRNWRRGDRAIDVHRRYNPNCEFVKSYCMQKISDAGNDDRRLYNDDDTASRDVVGVANQLDSERPAIKERIKKRVNNNTGLRIAPGSLRDLPQAYYTPASTSIHSQTVKDFDIWSSLDSPPPAEEISFVSCCVIIVNCTSIRLGYMG